MKKKINIFIIIIITIRLSSQRGLGSEAIRERSPLFREHIVIIEFLEGKNGTHN